MDEKSKAPHHYEEEEGRREHTKVQKYDLVSFLLPELEQVRLLFSVCVCVCEQLSCVHYESDTVHYLFISSVCLLATLCISACLAIIMPHALFKTHVHTDYDADSYLSVNHSLIASSVSL